MVEPIARRWFTYLERAKAPVQVVLGDARLSLAAAPVTQRYDLIIVDAFSSDSIPVHLLTREAVRVYLDHLKPGGLILLHISNRYLDLLPVVRGHAAALGVQGAFNGFEPEGAAKDDEGALASDVAALTESKEVAKRLSEHGWDLLDVNRRRVDWTDDKSSLLSLFKLSRRGPGAPRDAPPHADAAALP